MANPKTADSGAPEKPLELAKEAEPRTFDPRKWVHVYDAESGKKLPNPVPEHFLDGRFPNLQETPSKKEGK
ncbi:hypothetical protein AOC05_04945 [Arthrobacter alpinus]|uniref:Uncharacterized protein n=1 Tax=Arthrobacter alpinus TaxID=656366 RepID=A0A0M5M3J3_9MICC|nr:hypothetical protein [Arthrobacter alpinus]ALE91820.1 hypothetical protein AOC05_04945 [Arthrobacter alpinus]